MPPARSARAVFVSALAFECLLERCVSERRSGVRVKNAAAPPVYPVARFFMVLTSHFQAVCSAGDRRPATQQPQVPAFQAGGGPGGQVAAEEVVAAVGAPPTAAELRQAADAVPVGQGPSVPALAAGAQPTAGLLEAVKWARLQPRGEPSGLLRQGAAWRSL